MAQTELRLRLLKNGRIVGYEMKKHGVTLFADDRRPHSFIDHDSFEIGIKIHNKWVFEGDIIERPYPNEDCLPYRFEIKRNESGALYYVAPNAAKGDTLGTHWEYLSERMPKFKIVGNIHEQEETANESGN